MKHITFLRHFACSNLLAALIVSPSDLDGSTLVPVMSWKEHVDSLEALIRLPTEPNSFHEK